MAKKRRGAGNKSGIRLMQVKDANILNLALSKSYKEQLSAAVATTPPVPIPALSPPAAVSELVSTTVNEPVVLESLNTTTDKTLPVNPDVPAQPTPPRKRQRTGEETSSARRSSKASSAIDSATSSARITSTTRPSARYSDLGGVEGCLQDVRELIERPLMHPEIYVHLGVEMPRGILLHGPPGCGKTLLANAIAGELGLPFLKISAPEIVSGMSGESEQRLRELFQEAKERAPCIMFIDEVDAVTPKRDTAQREMERRIVAQLLTCFDELSMENTANRHVCVIAATNRPDSLDSALRRAGRFDREIAMGIPDETARARILTVMLNKLRLSGDFQVALLAKETPGFVGADLQALTKEAAVMAVNRIFQELQQKHNAEQQPPQSDHAARSDTSDFLRSIVDPLTPEQLEPLHITMEDFQKALKVVQPSSKREGFSTIPDVSWSDIGALDKVREELMSTVVYPIRYPEKYAAYGVPPPAGVLLFGPPGCGKTLLAKAIANQSRCNFISVKGPELLNKFVGESERAIRQVFQRARTSSPCIIFFDELDALAPQRASDSQSEASSRVVNTLLVEMDGLDARRNVFIIAATNRPDIIDSAMRRPGRLDKLVYVPLPEEDERTKILQTLSKKMPLVSDVDFAAIARRCNGMSGADLSGLLQEAAIAALKQTIDSGSTSDVPIGLAHFEAALTKIKPSVSKRDQERYEELRHSMS